ncbi:MAG TPA: RNA polymerase subunit sigma-24, partial [Porphyromonadaceae bacterium]|nr:RNA polymerase subunit sigma-24 [Porphyromonadaceae bacterium]HCM21962.1 RNA polymerase subunit sigma-24 [Porphyromonadaceae bacterium]
VRMKDVEEIDIREIAQILYMSENAVTVNLSRARKKLRDMIVTIQQSEEKQYERNR